MLAAVVASDVTRPSRFSDEGRARFGATAERVHALTTGRPFLPWPAGRQIDPGFVGRAGRQRPADPAC